MAKTTEAGRATWLNIIASLGAVIVIYGVLYAAGLLMSWLIPSINPHNFAITVIVLVLLYESRFYA